LSLSNVNSRLINHKSINVYLFSCYTRAFHYGRLWVTSDEATGNPDRHMQIITQGLRVSCANRAWFSFDTHGIRRSHSKVGVPRHFPSSTRLHYNRRPINLSDRLPTMGVAALYRIAVPWDASVVSASHSLTAAAASSCLQP
jgi:hypothetical protein